MIGLAFLLLIRSDSCETKILRMDTQDKAKTTSSSLKEVTVRSLDSFVNAIKEWRGMVMHPTDKACENAVECRTNTVYCFKAIADLCSYGHEQ
jgi:hypothetical protein